MSKNTDGILSACSSLKGEEQQRFKSSQPNNSALLSMVGSVIPMLTDDKHKGQCGRIAVIGGCQE